MYMMDAVLENRLLSRWGRLLPRPAASALPLHAADAELVPLGGGRHLALTVDTVAEEIEHGLYREPRTAGRIAVHASLSDLAAVGADVLGVLLAVTLPVKRPEVVQGQVAAGIREACDAAGVAVLGGDTNEGPRLQVSCVAAGLIDDAAPITRLGARSGDVLFASGPLGLGSALAARVLLGLDERLCAEGAFLPRSRLTEGRALRGIASACMDTSDGLIATLDQLARLNEVALHLNGTGAGMLHPVAEQVRQAAGLPHFPFLAGHHGEYELAFTVPPARVAALLRAAADLDWQPLELGHVRSGQGLFAGRRAIDGARVRNLLHETGGDLDAYLATLVHLGRDT